MAINRAAIYGIEKIAEQRSRGVRLKDYRDLLCGDFSRVQSPQSSFRGAPSHRFGAFEFRRFARRGVPVIALHRTVLFGYGRDAQAATRRTIAPNKTARVYENSAAGIRIERRTF